MNNIVEKDIERIQVLSEDGYLSTYNFKNLEEASEYLLEKLHCAGKIMIINKNGSIEEYRP